MAALAVSVGGKLRPAQVHGQFASRLERAGRAGQIARQAQFAGEDIDGAQREDAQPDGGQGLGNIGDAVDHFVGGAVAAGGNNGAEAIARGLGGQLAGIARPAGQAHDAVRIKGGQAGAKGLGFLPLGKRIENEARLHAASR